MRFDDEVLIEAPVDVVWKTYADVERWPEWTASMREVRFVAASALALGARVHIAQPKLRPGDWEVTALEPGRSWTWRMKLPGLRMSATHEVEPAGAGATRVRQSVEMTGALAGIIGRLYAGLTRRYLAMEAAGLKKRCEAG